VSCSTTETTTRPTASCVFRARRARVKGGVIVYAPGIEPFYKPDNA
jgi:hypothetical protein